MFEEFVGKKVRAVVEKEGRLSTHYGIVKEVNATHVKLMRDDERLAVWHQDEVKEMVEWFEGGDRSGEHRHTARVPEREEFGRKVPGAG